jgi:type VI secretion system secreted protein Hcp
MDMFLRIDGIPGESTRKGHEKWIPLESAGWGVSQVVAAHHGAGGGAARGRAEFRPAVFSAWTSVATPLLFEACVSGRHAATASFEAVRTGESPAVHVRWDFEDVLITNLDMAGSEASPTMTDSFSLDYERVRVTTFAQDPKGGVGSATARGWDLTAHRPW